MINRLLLYFGVVLVIVIMATSFNRFVIDKKKTVSEVIDETSDYFQKTVDRGEKQESAQRDTATVPAAVDAPFKSWFEEEAQLVGSTQINTKEKEAELKVTAQSLSTERIEFLKKTIDNPAASQNEKILSTYLLSLAADVPALGEIASRPLNTNPAEAHSLEEVQNQQARAKAIMAIDAIAESGGSLSVRIDELRKIINKQSDPTVRDYAQRKQSELQSQQ